MEIHLEQKPGKYEFTAFSEGKNLPIVAKPELSGDAEGFRPMELMLASLAGCMSIDTLLILNKQKQNPESFKISVSGLREETPPNIFSDIQLRIKVKGQVEESKLQRAIDLSKDKYCTAYAILSKSANIHVSYTLNDEQ